MLETPVLFLIFNRPNTTRRVFEKIREVRPKKLFIAADGPRENRPGEQEKCLEVRHIATNVDWNCEVQTLFRKKNLGCGIGPYTAINWFFEQVDEGIILEDDILPDMSFFTFCQQLLNLYREHQKVMMISGFNVCEKWKDDVQDYHFSYFGGVWGWASWKRAWAHYDYHLKAWANPNVKGALLNCFPEEARERREKMYDTLFTEGNEDIWDLQWTFAKLLNSGLSVIPSTNLVENIGFGEGATHTTDKGHIWANIRAHSITFPLREPKAIIRDEEYDKRHLYPQIIRKKSPFLKLLERLLTWR